MIIFVKEATVRLPIDGPLRLTVLALLFAMAMSSSFVALYVLDRMTSFFDTAIHWDRSEIP